MKTRQIGNAAFLLVLVGFLLAGLFRTVVIPKDINYYENRGAYKMQRPTRSGIFSGSFQSSLENALSDQVWGSQTMKSAFNETNSSYQLSMIKGILAANPDKYVSVLGSRCFGGEYMVAYTMTFADQPEAVEPMLESIRRAARNHPDLPVYCYYIERDTDINFETGERTFLSSYIQQQLSLPEGHFYTFETTDFEDYKTTFYRTDHHWNYRGSYEAYCGILAMLKPGETPLAPLEEVKVGDGYSGSRSLTAGAVKCFTETFTAYRFDYPDLTVELKGQPAEAYGGEQRFLRDHTIDGVTYGLYYGGDAGLAVFHGPGTGKLLIFGESYDNAILKLLASHFETIYAIDLRNYENDMGKPFRLSEFLESNPVDMILFGGSNSYFRLEAFLVED